MKITIDEEVCKKHNLSFAEVIGMLFVKSTDNAYLSLEELEKSEKIISYGKESDIKLVMTERWDNELSSVIFESDEAIPPVEKLEKLAEQLREIFPKGIKPGTKTSAWRGNKREITLRLQRFFKLYGCKYTPEEIIEATRKYVELHNGDYTRMRILKYFIMKNITVKDEDGIGHIEDVSDLATFLENDCVSENTDDWLIELR